MVFVIISGLLLSFIFLAFVDVSACHNNSNITQSYSYLIKDNYCNINIGI